MWRERLVYCKGDNGRQLTGKELEEGMLTLADVGRNGLTLEGRRGREEG